MVKNLESCAICVMDHAYGRTNAYQEALMHQIFPRRSGDSHDIVAELGG